MLKKSHATTGCPAVSALFKGVGQQSFRKLGLTHEAF